MTGSSPIPGGTGRWLSTAGTQSGGRPATGGQAGGSPAPGGQAGGRPAPGGQPMGGVMVNPMGGEMMAGAVAPVDECAAATDNCDANAQCVDTADGFECRCNSGYAGNGVVCADVNECDNANGGCAQNCANNDGGFVCSCAGFSLNAAAPVMTSTNATMPMAAAHKTAPITMGFCLLMQCRLLTQCRWPNL